MCQIISIDFKTKTLNSVSTTIHSSPDFDIYQFQSHLPLKPNPFFDLVQARLNKAVKGISNI